MSTGPQGVQGIQGVQGVQGLSGPTGIQGVRGLQGIPGLPGGPTGPTGPGGGGGGGSAASLITLSTYTGPAQTTIANAVTQLSSTNVVIWSNVLPEEVKGRTGVLSVFFSLYSLTTFNTSTAFDYGLYIDGNPISLGESSNVRYIQTTNSSYALSSNGYLLGTNGITGLMPINIPLYIPPTSTLLILSVANSALPLSPVSSIAVGYTSNNLTSTGTSNTSSFVPQTAFRTAGSNTYVVPSTVSTGTVTGVYIYCWGSGGQGTNNGAGRACVGGGGGFAGGFYSVAAGTTLTYIVGGVPGTGSLATGGGGVGGGNTSGQGYDGGGFSGVFLGVPSQSTAICIAGGGGAGGLGGSNVAGCGGYPTGGAAKLYNSPYTTSTLILGGSQTAGGVGTRNAGSALSGAASSGGSDGGGAGGGGWYGGGSHNGGNWGGGSGYFGGAGGSSYIGNVLGATPSPAGIGLTSSAVTSNGTYPQSYTPAAPGGITNPYYSSGATYGYGDTTSLRTGAGMIAIIPAVGTNPVYVGVTAKMLAT